MINHTNEKPIVKAVGLISGGLDSTIAAKVVKDLGVDVYGVFFAMPWGCCDKTFAIEAAQSIGIKFITLQLDERYLEVVRTPKFGRGSAMNPCIDCRIHMFSRAAQYMKHLQADFVFTGEVLGQRPMSQKKLSLDRIEEASGLKGRLLRPLSAQHLEPTEVEKQGLIDRAKLLDLSGRSRKGQLSLAEEYKLTGYSAPAGGCLLTDQNFSARIKDTFQHGYRNFRETISLKWGRHYRFNKQFKCIVGRDHEENEGLIRYAHPDDILMQFTDNLGPTLLLKGENPTPEILGQCAGMIQRFSRHKDSAPQQMKYWVCKDRNNIQYITAIPMEDKILEQFKI